MPCEEKRTKKYLNRKSPPYAANEEGCRGTVKQGHDGKWYTSTRASNGVYRWIKNSDAGGARAGGEGEGAGAARVRAAGGGGGGGEGGVHQCEGIKANGVRCSRLSEAGSHFCWQHK